MSDVIIGKVIRVTDGDTFVMRVDKYKKSNTWSYNAVERIRIADSNAPELGTWEGVIAKNELEEDLLHKVVVCIVHARDDYGRVIATIKIRRQVR